MFNCCVIDLLDAVDVNVLIFCARFSSQLLFVLRDICFQRSKSFLISHNFVVICYFEIICLVLCNFANITVTKLFADIEKTRSTSDTASSKI